MFYMCNIFQYHAAEYEENRLRKISQMKEKTGEFELWQNRHGNQATC